MDDTIRGVETKKLVWHEDFRGAVAEILRNDDAMFEKFGQVYVTTCNPGIAKAWHYHENHAEYFSCAKGVLKLVLYDAREDSPTRGVVQEFIISRKNPLIIKVPPYVYHGFECGSDEELIVVNVKTEPFNPAHPDKVRIPYNDSSIPYKWSAKMGG
jgi:dTDP-4-dehydrorhamnose 3,5-epimerase